MGHRHLFSKPQMFEGDNDQNWNHVHMDQHYVHLGRPSTSENGSFIYPVENMSTDGVSFPSHWNPAIRSNDYASSSLNIEVPPHQSDASGSSHDHFLHTSSAAPFFAATENCAHQLSSSYDRQAFHVDGNFIDLTVGNVSGPNKRKSPGIPSVCERGSTSRYFNAGSSTDLPTSSELWQEKPNVDPQYMHWDMASSFRGSCLTIRGEGSLRNVRSRAAHDLESNRGRTHLSSNNSHIYTGPPIDHSDLSVQSSSTLMWDCSQMNISSANGGMLSSDTSGFGEASHFLVGSGASSASVDAGPYHHEFGTSRIPSAPPSFHGNVTQTARGVRINHSQRFTPAFGASSSMCLGQVAPSDDGLHMVAESYSSRHPRPLATIGCRNGDRNGRSRISADRYRSLADENSLRDRYTSEGFMIVERTSLHGSRNMLDQHRDMRMDIDNMSYEELLALGERIGHVSTGLSEDLISKCLTETIYCSSDQSQEEGNCVICLEEYTNMDDVGTLKSCGHDYHVICIRKWLSVKNLCPICKASALADNIKDK